MSVYNELRLNQQLCDVVIRVKDVEFHGHKIVLCHQSPYFRFLFTEWSTPDKRDFDIPTVPADIMKLIIDFIYTDLISVTEDNVQELFKAASEFAVMGIVDACCSFMEEHLTPQNCIGFWLFTAFNYTLELNRKAFSFIMNHFEEVAATSIEFLLLSEDKLVEIIEKDQLIVKQEKMVFEAILRWIAHATGERKECIHRLLSNVRLALMSPEYLNNTLSNNGLVRASERCQQIISMTLETKLNPQTQRFSGFVRPRLPPAILFAVGGRNPRSLDNGIEAYDVRADCWVKITGVEKSPLAYSSTVFHDGSFYSVGGLNGVEWLKSLQRFDLSTNTWYELSHMHSSRGYGSITVLGGYIYAIGGFNGRDTLRTAERYDPCTNQWTVIAPMNEWRQYASCTTLDGKVYICGGHNGAVYVSSAECYDPATNRWERIADMGSRRCRHGTIAYAGRVFAVGGISGDDQLQTVEAYNPDTNTWKDVPSMPGVRTNFGIEVIDDRLFVVGGYNGFFTTSEVECFDVNTGEWSTVCKMEISRRILSCCVVYGLPNLAKYAAPRHSPQVSKEDDDIEESSNKEEEEDIVE